MEGSFVKLKIAEKEERLKIDREKKSPAKPVNGMVQKDGKYYLVKLEMELEKLKSLINEAESDQRLAQITEEASGKIRNAIGKAQLLITKKFKQFEELCRDNIEDNPEKWQNEMETKSSDLQGYWEMMFTQIDDVKALFSHIEKLKANNWRTLEGDVIDSPPPRNEAAPSPTEKIKTSSKSNDSSPKVRKKKKTATNDDKQKKEARSRLAAIRKQAKLRQQEDPESFTIQINGCENVTSNGCTNKQNGNGHLNNNETLESSENGSLNSSFNADASLNSSLNSSLEGLSDNNSCDIHPSMATTEGER